MRWLRRSFGPRVPDPKRSAVITALLLQFTLFYIPISARTQAVGPVASHPELIFIDTDMGDDIDDAFAVALALQSPELRILGITTTFGDTALRAHLMQRLLADTGHSDIPVAAGPPTAVSNVFTQRQYALHDPKALDHIPTGEPALALFAAQVRAHPHEVTLIALGPLTTVEFLLDRDPAAFHLLKRVVMMGGSIERGYKPPVSGVSAESGSGSQPEPHPDPEWNIVNGISGARKLLASGIALTLLPLDSTQIPLEEVRRQILFANGSPVTDALTLLYHQWGAQTPTLYDPLTVATILDSRLCPTEPMRLRVDDKGYTRRESSAPNAQVCLRSDKEGFLDLLTTRLLASPVAQSSPAIAGH